ncbi:MAG: hypothetical protein IPJ14_23395 [Kineosporiaceae bacterium]|nr:hypothetical protein [Kineosporiaceae bacterium]MBK8076119.1 hypothetical protein [Kineosporiaceae bacterium]
MAELDVSSLNRVLGRIQNQISDLSSEITVVGGHVMHVGQETALTRSELGQLRLDFEQFVAQAERIANIQRAETKIVGLHDEVEHKFGHHKIVRRSAIGVLQQFDTGLVSEDTVRDIGEQLMIQTPRYWLAPVLVALAAWAADNQDLCNRAVEEAFRRSPDKASLFFALVLRRQGRQEAAVRWLRHYLRGLDPTSLGRDFAVILESISQGAFGPAGRELVAETLEGWRAALAHDAEVNDAQVKRWIAECEERTPVVETSAYPRLAKISPQWPVLRTALSGAQAQRALLDKYGAMASEEIPVNVRLEDAVDDILDRLVQEYDTDELPLRRELAFNRAVIDHGGDLTRAKVTADAESAGLEETLDYLTIQSTSALRPEHIGVSRATQRMAVGACQEWFTEAHNRFTFGYRSALPSDVEAHLDYQHTIASKVFNLPLWKGSFTTQMDQLEQDLGAHWDLHAKPYIDSFAFNWQRAAILPAAVAGLLFVLLVGASPGAALIVAAIVGGVWGFIIYRRHTKALEAQRQATNTIMQAKQQSVAELRGAGAELTDWSSRYTQADSCEPQTRQLIASLATFAHGRSDFDGRVVA